MGDCVKSLDVAEILPHDISWPNVEARWHCESELHAPPRRVVPRTGAVGCGGKVMGCFINGMMAFMFAVGLLMSLWAGLALLILPFGVSTPGVVTRHEVGQGSGRSGTQSYFLHFWFTWNNETYQGKWPVSSATYTEIRDGEKVTVRCFPFAPAMRPLIEEGVSPWFNVWVLGPLGLLMLALGGGYLLAVLASKRGRALVKRGEATAGVIVRREESEARGTGGEVDVLYRVGGQTLEKRFRLGRSEFETLRLGEVATVLFEVKRPKRALLYRCCDFRAAR